MRIRLFCLMALPVLMVSAITRPTLAEDPKNDSKDKELIAKNAEAFVEAFHKGDAKAVAAFWAPDGDYTDQSGKQIEGREAIEKAFASLFEENKGLKLRIEGTSLRFVTPNVAIEDGITEVFHSENAPPSRGRFTNVHVKKNGQWLLNSVRETVFTPPSNYEHLRGLEWAVGDWASENGEGPVQRISLDWNEGQNWIKGSFSTTFGDMSLGHIKQWIGWDPDAKRVRSWSFDDSGAFGEGSWSKDGNKWVIKSIVTLQGGKKAKATFIVGYIDPETISLQSTDRTLGDDKLPDMKESLLKRVK